MMSSGTCNKVNTSTQVEYNFEEPRRIVGQEDTAIESLSKSSSSLSLRKQSKGIRPPLVGQASSSSNDSVSLSFETRSIGNTHDGPVTSPTQNNSEANQRNDSLDRQRTSYLLSRNDYINQKPPEGSYCHIYTPSQPTESNHDLSRVRSSSSASSVTSSRPLEWDNGADVGYSQSHVISGNILDPTMSTVERMALVSSSKLLRSDPEGTTGGTCQQINNSTQPKLRVKKKFSHPNAESTPLGSHVASEVSPDIGDFISPIPYERREDFEPGINSSESEVCGQKLFKPLQDEYTENQPTICHVNEATKMKVPLFPEMNIGNYLPNDIEKVDMARNSDENGLIRVQRGERKNIVESCTAFHKNVDNEVYINSKMQSFNNEPTSKLEPVDSVDMVHKKLSSSLENIHNINSSAPSNGKVIPNTLPRSQSQTDLYLEKLSHENIISSKVSKGNIVIQNLFKNKSASSSSVATVVHRKDDSPKHVHVQTSIFKNQSVGTQVNESIDRNTTNSKPFTGSVISETPHLPKAVLTHQLTKKSNYFGINDDPDKYKNAPVEQPLVGANDKCERKEFISTNVGNHFHNGILCRGAHKKNLVSNESPDYLNQYNSNFINSNNCGLVSSVSAPFASNKYPQTAVCSNMNQRKNISGSIIDSVESSIKSGGCGTDKQYSVTVEDRVNSFEYLPGHVYENNERQQPIISCGTSSMSIENQTSNNATPEDQNKVWESSGGGSVSSTFEKDAQRGVDILSDFVKGAYDNDTLLKRKLIRRVVDKLISKNHINHKNIESYQDLMKNTPWVPPRPSNPVERNTIKTPKSKVPCEFSSRSEKSGATNTSSECFIPKLADRNKCFPSFFRDDSCQKYQGEISSTSNVTPETTAKSLDRSPKSLKLMDSNTQKIRKSHTSKPNVNSSSNKVLRTDNWKEPATKTEKLIEERRKIQNESSGSHSSVSQLLDMERENQLFWIRSEIEHLSNLKLLLERQEELKRGLKNCKLRQSKSSERNVLKNKNRVEKDKTEAAISAQMDAVSKKSSLKTKSSHPPKLNEWLKGSLIVPKSHDIDFDGWASHHYENDENIKSCIKKKNKRQTQQSQTRTPTVDKDYVIYDEPLISFQRRKHDLKPQKRLNATDENSSDSASMHEKDCKRRNVTDRLGPPTQVDRPSQRAELGCQCLCRGKCKCCTKHTNTNIDDKRKEPLGYYIIFDNPKKSDNSNMGKHQIEEMGISWSVGERKQKPARQIRMERQRAGADNIKEKGRADVEKEANNWKRSELPTPESEPTSNESENDRNKIDIESKKHIFKGGAGELQYHLLHNRPSYVSRAEDRRQCIAQMQYLRELSGQNKRRFLSLTQPEPPPPPPIKMQRVFSQHKMRQMTEKKYQQLSEVREKLQDTKKKESYRTNRLMAEIFKKNLQKRVLKGEVNLSNSVFVISSL